MPTNAGYAEEHINITPLSKQFKKIMPFFKATSVACMPTPPVAPKIAILFIVSDYGTNDTQTHPQNRQVTPLFQLISTIELKLSNDSIAENY